MKISIITTTYNVEDYIEETVESVLSQRGDFSIEYIVYDCNSTDSTFEKIKKYKNLVDSGFYKERNLGIDMYIYQENDNGMYDGIAKGFKKATGDVVAYINGDDFYLPNAFSCVCEIFNKYNHINWIMGTITTADFNGTVNFSNNFNNFSKKLIKKGAYGKYLYFIQQESCFWRRSLLNCIDFEKFKALKLCGDFYLWYCFSQNNNVLYCVNANLACFRYRKSQKSENKEDYYNEMNSFIKNNKLSIKDKIFIYYIRHLDKVNSSENLFGNYIYYDRVSADWHISQKKTNLLLIKINLKIFIDFLKLFISSIFVRL